MKRYKKVFNEKLDESKLVYLASKLLNNNKTIENSLEVGAQGIEKFARKFNIKLSFSELSHFMINIEDYYNKALEV